MSQDVVLAIHEEQIAEHGGALGIRGIALLESALDRPRNLYAYSENPLPDLAAFAAAYAFGIARNHPFLDGNKRTSLVAAETFLELGGWRLGASDEECCLTILALAEGRITEHQLTAWLRDSISPI